MELIKLSNNIKKPKIAQLFKKSLALYTTQRFNIAFTTAHYWSLSSAILFQYTLSHPTFIAFTLRMGEHYHKKYQQLITTQHTLVCSPSSDVKIGNLQLEANTSVPIVPMFSGLDSTYNEMKRINDFTKYTHV
jgi:hypothetical protein